ncbi:hypothetical protein EFL81_09995 [Weissella confusa]|uniref:hypothetical protein n=1 Tax=Weissella confusa TaxID=1583 RepID=UPI00223B739F|nr:hypothetical protein [Weissella confusa]MCS9997142.1 hypothetical protein [Weissella confusa]
MVDFEFKIIGVEKGTHSLNSDNGGEWNVEDLPDAPDYVLHEHDFYTEEQVREILIKFGIKYLPFIDETGVNDVVDDWLLEASIG